MLDQSTRHQRTALNISRSLPFCFCPLKSHILLCARQHAARATCAALVQRRDKPAGAPRETGWLRGHLGDSARVRRAGGDVTSILQEQIVGWRRAGCR